MSGIEKIGGNETSDPKTHDRKSTDTAPMQSPRTTGTEMPSARDEGSADRSEAGRHGRNDPEPTDGGTRPRELRRLLSRFSDLMYRKIVEPLVLSRNPPWFDARGVAFGLAVGLGLPMGAHTVALVLVRFLLRFNFIVSVGVAAIVNPLTIIPLYYGYYCLGSFLMGKPAELDQELFENLMHPIVNKSHSWEAVQAFTALSGDILTRWAMAAALVATLFGLAGYMVTEKIQARRCRTAAKNMGMSYRAYLSRLAQQSAEKDTQSNESPTPTESTK